MKIKSGNASPLILLILIIILCGGLWIWNLVKFVSCDFESGYRCEVIHGIGVAVPPASLVTVWFGDDGI